MADSILSSVYFGVLVLLLPSGYLLILFILSEVAEWAPVWMNIAQAIIDPRVCSYTKMDKTSGI